MSVALTSHDCSRDSSEQACACARSRKCFTAARLIIGPSHARFRAELQKASNHRAFIQYAYAFADDGGRAALQI